jgi:hypothetical protein
MVKLIVHYNYCTDCHLSYLCLFARFAVKLSLVRLCDVLASFATKKKKKHLTRTINEIITNAGINGPKATVILTKKVMINMINLKITIKSHMLLTRCNNITR